MPRKGLIINEVLLLMKNYIKKGPYKRAFLFNYIY